MSRPRWLVIVLAAVTLSGCSAAVPAHAPGIDATDSPTSVAPDASGPPEAVEQSTTLPREPLRYNDPVREPKDASGIEACELLTSEQARQVGLAPESAEQRGSGKIQTCVWSAVGDPTRGATIQKNIETGVPILDGLYLIREGTLFYEEREVAGYPAVRGELSDTGTCTFTVAVADYQGVGFQADMPESDPCSTSVRMAEFVLSNLPPLIEE